MAVETSIIICARWEYRNPRADAVMVHCTRCGGDLCMHRENVVRVQEMNLQIICWDCADDVVMREDMKFAGLLGPRGWGV